MPLTTSPQVHRRDFDGERWSNHATTLLFLQGGSVTLAWAALWWKQLPPSPTSHALYASMGIPVLAAGTLTLRAMQLIDYPTVALAKAAKPLGVLLVAGVAGRAQVYTVKQRTMVLLVTLGLMLFYVGKEGMPFVSSTASSSALLGYACILTALVMDGLACLACVTMTSAQCPPDSFELQFWVNLWCWSLVLVYATATGSLAGGAAFIRAHPDVLWLLGGLALLSGTGNVFIYLALVAFNPLVVSLITTLRKFSTIVLSAVVFRHHLNALQWFAVAILFVGLLWRDVYDAVQHAWRESRADDAGKSDN